MNWLIFHLASGHVFFTGTGLMILAAGFSVRRDYLLRRASGLSFLLGVIAVVVSSTPVPHWLAAAAVGSAIAWITAQCLGKWTRPAAWTLIAVLITGVALEVPYHLTPVPRPAADRSLTIIGDSLAAGVGDGDIERWPEILARDHNIAVQDLSHMGDTVATAIERVDAEPVRSPVVLVEIGGNDLLGSTTPEEFARDLDTLLDRISAPRRQVIMFELPLPPLCQRYARAQRTLARKHGVALIPKRVLIAVLTEEAATLDMIHLSQAGHRRLAADVWAVLRPAFQGDW